MSAEEGLDVRATDRLAEVRGVPQSKWPLNINLEGDGLIVEGGWLRWGAGLAKTWCDKASFAWLIRP